jgi:predicted metal-dependent phosphoesterase TrpH
MLRGDFHHHTNADPIDNRFVQHSLGELIDRAARIGLRAISVTCHESVPYDGDAERYARERGVVLLRGMEATVEKQHVLLINFREFPRGRCTIDEIRAAKTADALVIAPHPFYPAGIASADLLLAYPDLFDAVEVSGLYTRMTASFNRSAIRYAEQARLPMVGNSDTHFLWQMGSTYTEIDAEPDAASIVEAVRRGRVRLRTEPLALRNLVEFIVRTQSTLYMMRNSIKYLMRIVRRSRGPVEMRAAIPSPGSRPG